MGKPQTRLSIERIHNNIRIVIINALRAKKILQLDHYYLDAATDDRRFLLDIKKDHLGLRSKIEKVLESLFDKALTCKSVGNHSIEITFTKSLTEQYRGKCIESTKPKGKRSRPEYYRGS